jgi:hypothetical protein
MAAKISQTWGFKRTDLKTENFYSTYNNDYSITSMPWYLSIDGSFFLYFLFSVKDSEEEVRDLTQEERKKYERQSDTYTFSYKYEAQKEKAVKINVKNFKNPSVDDATEKIEALSIEDKHSEPKA